MTSDNFSYILSTFLNKFLPGKRNLSTNTIFAYTCTFGRLFSFSKEVKGITEEKFSLDDLNDDFVFDFITWLKESCGASPATQKQRLAAIHAFVIFLMPRYPARMFEWQKILEVKVKCPPQSNVGYLSREAMEKLLSMPDTSTADGMRDLALLGLMYDGALRVQEVCDAMVEDVRLSKPGIIRVTGKGGKTAIVELVDSTIHVLSAYIKIAKKKNDDVLFTNHQGMKFTRAGIAYLLHKYAEMARKTMPNFPERIFPHMLRHSKAMHLMNGGVNIIYIRDHLRHSQLATTQIYAKADTQIKSEIIRKTGLHIASDDLMKDWRDDKQLMSELRRICSKKPKSK